MTGKFRGAERVGDKLEVVEGIGCLYTGGKVYIVSGNGASEVLPDSAGFGITVPCLGTIYKGDVIRYSFKEKSETYNRYYIVIEDDGIVKFKELYRDYGFSGDSYDVVRGKFTDNAGALRAVDKPLAIFETYTLLGNVYEHPELEA